MGTQMLRAGLVYHKRKCSAALGIWHVLYSHQRQKRLAAHPSIQRPRQACTCKSRGPARDSVGTSSQSSQILLQRGSKPMLARVEGVRRAPSSLVLTAALLPQADGALWRRSRPSRRLGHVVDGGRHVGLSGLERVLLGLRLGRDFGQERLKCCPYTDVK